VNSRWRVSGRRFFVEEVPISLLKMNAASLGIRKVLPNKQLPQTFVLSIGVEVLIITERRDMGAKHPSHVDRYENLVTKGECGPYPFLRIRPFRILRVPEFEFGILLVEFKPIRNWDAALGTRK